MSTPRSSVTAAVLLAALGYFVDIYDLVLFSVLRVSSLKSLGVDEAGLVPTGGVLLDLQLGGMILGGVAWGVLADKRGRLTVLFGSIVIYSLGNLANAFVDTVWAYGACRLVAGFGLAGELGAGITLVSELLPKERRGLGTTLVASIGLSGALAAGLIGDALVTRLPVDGWRYAYALGGGVGLLLLVLRLSVFESGLFERTKSQHVPHGDVRQLLFPMERGLRFLRVIMVGMPIWFVAGVLFVFSPEIGLALGLPQKPTGGQTIFWAYAGVTIGDVASGLVSHAFKNRKRVIGVFLELGRGERHRVAHVRRPFVDDLLRADGGARLHHGLLGALRDDSSGAVRHQPARDRDDERSELRARHGDSHHRGVDVAQALDGHDSRDHDGGSRVHRAWGCSRCGACPRAPRPTSTSWSGESSRQRVQVLDVAPLRRGETTSRSHERAIVARLKRPT
jgi:MFS family permease